MSQRIMIVDDSSSLRQVVKFSLEQAGYDVIEASDGQDALEKLALNRVKMVITDLFMPRMDGIELIRQMRSEPSLKFLPVIMLTTESSVDKKTEGKQAGATGWIIKPFSPEQLIGVVRKVLRRE